MAVFQVIPGGPSSTVVLHVPHASTRIPSEVRAGILPSDSELSVELAAITDADTDVVAEGAAALAAVRPWVFANRVSRLVIDPERFPDEREEMNAVGMGAVYERTTQLEVLREPTDAERAGLIDEYYTPYAESLAQLVRDRLAVNGRVTIVDVHSYSVAKLPYELHGDGSRPEVCVGTDAFHTSDELARVAVAAMGAAAGNEGQVGLNSPFSGCYVPLDQYGVNPLVQSVMLEVRRDVVSSRMDELQVATAALLDCVDGSP
ncbi:N-formylglutamate amidohydrolase [Salana multivorans]